MATNTTPTFPPSRRDPRQVLNTLRFTINWNDVGTGAQEGFFSSLPAGAIIADVLVMVTTTFNAGSTNVLTVGTNSAAFNNIVASGDVNLGSVGTYNITRGQGLNSLLTATVDQAVNAKYAQTGTAATQGQAVVLITFEGGWLS